MITHFNTYTDGVMISASTKQDGWRKDMPPVLYNTMHGSIGLTTEVGELLMAICVPVHEIDWVNVKEELGDLWWYAALIYEAHGRDIPDTVLDGIHNTDQHKRASGSEIVILINDLMVRIGNAMDVIKRRIYYGSGDEDVKAAWSKVDVLGIVANLLEITESCGFRAGDVWTTNLAKLIGPNGRYAGKFDPALAVCRDLIKEREVLEDE